MPFYASLARCALQEQLLTRDELEALLRRAPDEGLIVIGTTINAALYARVMKLLDSSPFPLGGRRREELVLPFFGVGHGCQLWQTWESCFVHDLSVLQKASPAPRAWVWSQLDRLVVPFMDGLSITDTYWHTEGISSAMKKLAATPNVGEEHMEEQFFELIRLGEFFDEDEEAGGPRHYAVGTMAEWKERCRVWLPIYWRRGDLLAARVDKDPPRPVNAFEERWIDLGRRARQLRTWFARRKIDFYFDQDEMRPIDQANVLTLDRAEEQVVDWFFSQTDTGDGELPGVVLDMSRDHRLVHFCLYPVLTASVFAALDELAKKGGG